MDLTKEYIKQADCPEIQEGKVHDGVGGTWVSDEVILCTYGDVGSYYYVHDTIATRKCPQCGHEEEHIESTHSIWLPRQDELQAMYLKTLSVDEQESSNVMVVMLDDFRDWVLNDCTGLEWSYGKRVSMEQLWLAFLMRDKHNKVWVNDKWVMEGK